MRVSFSMLSCQGEANSAADESFWRTCTFDICGIKKILRTYVTRACCSSCHEQSCAELSLRA